MHGRKEGRKAGLPAVGLGAQRTHMSATRPVDWLMPSQVPSARTSRPESTFSLPFRFRSSWTTGTVSLEGASVVNASNEWKCAGSVGRARYSSRFANRILPPPRLADESEERVQVRERDAQCVVRMCEGPEADAHARRRGQKEWRISDGND
jgi:hypothetical protein